MENDKKEKSFFPQEYKWQQMVLIGLGVLSIGFAIAFIGYGYMMRNNSIIPIYPNPFKLPANTASPTPSATGNQTTPTPGDQSNPTPTNQELQICSTDSDCPSDQRCLTSGAIIKDQPIIMHCYP